MPTITFARFKSKLFVRNYKANYIQSIIVNLQFARTD